MTEVKFKEAKFASSLRKFYPRRCLRDFAGATAFAICLAAPLSPVLTSSAFATEQEVNATHSTGLRGQGGENLMDLSLEITITEEQFAEAFRAAAEAQMSRRPISTDLTPVQNQGDSNSDQTSEWTLPFSFADLPEGTRPDRFEFTVVSDATSDMAGQLLHVFLNDSVLRTLRPNRGTSGTGSQRYSVALPYDLMSLDNDLRVLVQNQACSGPCGNDTSNGPALTLLNGGLQLTSSNRRPEEFFELAPYFRTSVDVALRASVLTDPARVIEALLAMGPSILPADANINFHFVPDGMRFAPRGPFILYGVAPLTQEKTPLRLDRGEVTIQSREGETILSLADYADAAVVQMLTIEGHTGIWVNEPFPTAFGANDLNFNRGNVAVIDGAGVALWLNSEASRGLRLDYVSGHFIADFFAANRLVVLILIWSLLTVLLLRGVLAGRTNTSAKGAA